MMKTLLRLVWPVVSVVAVILTVFVLWMKIEGRGVSGSMFCWYLVIGLLFAAGYIFRNIASKKTSGKCSSTSWRVMVITISLLVVIPSGLVLLQKIRISAVATTGECFATEASIGAIQEATSEYTEDFGCIPTEQEGLRILMVNTKGKTYLNCPEIPRDAWGNLLRYSVRRDRPVVWSVGKDGMPNTRDDIVLEGMGAKVMIGPVSRQSTNEAGVNR